MKRLRFINSWDLVDSSAEHIVGGWLDDKPRVLLEELARSPHLWSRRVAMLATFRFIKRGDHREAIRIATLLVNDTHDLIHKAVGWMLRETGKRASAAALSGFLQRHAATMPRTMLRYAVERLSPAERSQWMTAPPGRPGPRSHRAPRVESIGGGWTTLISAREEGIRSSWLGD